MPRIIAVDFDGCLVEDAYPEIGEPIAETVAKLKREQCHGAKVILWTCRAEAHLADAVEWCKTNGIRLDAVNENLLEVIWKYGGDTRKIFADEYWDDRAVRMPKEDTEDT